MDTQKVRRSRSNEQRLRYALRATGFAVVLASTFFLMKSITLDPVANGFFAVSAGLGFLILVAGWLPVRDAVIHEPILRQPVVRQTTTYRPVSHTPRPSRTPAFQPALERRR